MSETETTDPTHLAVGQWHGWLCLLGKAPTDWQPQTLLRERVTCAECLALWDRLEERGWPVKRHLQWWCYRRMRGGRWSERLWRREAEPSNERRREAQREGYRLERVLVIDARSLAHHAESLVGGEP